MIYTVPVFQTYSFDITGRLRIKENWD